MADRPKVLLTNAIHDDAMAILAPVADTVTAEDTKPDTLRAAVRNVDGIIVRAQLPDDIMEHGPRLKGIVRHGVGLDFIPVEAATRHGVPVANLPGSNTQAVAEYVMSALFHLRRPLGRYDGAHRADGWWPARGLSDGSSEIGGTTLGIIGMGAIGSRVAAIARNGFGLTVLGHNRSGRMPDGVTGADLPTLFARSDAVAVCCALTPETRGLVSAELMAAMPAHAVLVNISRGPVIDTAALTAALSEGRIAGAAIDVYDQHPLPADSPLFTVPNLLMTPHLAALTATSARAMGVGAAEDMVRILNGERPRSLVNPDCFASREEAR